MSMFIHGRLGHYLQDETGEGGDTGGGSTETAQTTATTTADAEVNVEASSLLGEVKTDAPTDTATTEQKTDEAKEGETKEGEEKDKAAEGAPEVYEAFKAPDGIELDETVMPEIHEIFKELGLPQDKAQEIFEKFLGIQEKLAGTPEQQMQAAEQQIVALNSRLAEECKNLPDIGGEKFGESLTIASKVMQQFGSPEFRQLIAYTGVGSHPEFFKMMVAIGSKMSPDNFVQGGEEARTERRGEEIMFGHLFQK